MALSSIWVSFPIGFFYIYLVKPWFVGLEIKYALESIVQVILPAVKQMHKEVCNINSI